MVENGSGARNPIKHTVSVAPGTVVYMETEVDAPGQWAFHCHLAYHADSGMFRKVIVEGVNTAKRHTKGRSQEEPGGIIDKDMPMDVSNVAVLSPKDGKPTRVGYKVDGDTKVRVCKRTGAEIPEASDS